MIVVSDTSAITSLLQIQRADLLSKLYEEVLIPMAVAKELERDHPVLPTFIKPIPVSNQSSLERLMRELDRGEAEAITLMIEGKGNLLLIDERKGRRIAQREGIAVIGLLGVLIEAKKRGLVSSVGIALDDLENIAGFRISLTLRKRVMDEAGE